LLGCVMIGYLPHAGAVLSEGGQFLLHTVYTVDGVNEQNEDEDECDLGARLAV
jgi:hypothetical protein